MGICACPWSRRLSCSAAPSARSPISSRRRCTPSPTATATASHCARKRLPASCVRQSSIVCSTMGRRKSGPAARCSVMSGHRRDDIGNSIRSMSRLWVSPGRTSMPSKSSCSPACGGSSASPTCNSIGDVEARARHRVDLVRYFEAHLDQLDEDARRRLHSNPLRTLDSKNPRLQHLVEAAPKLADYLDDAAREHFTVLQALLDAAGIGFVVDPRLVRGFDYYNRTVFEWITTRLGSQGTIAGGGRYDGLIEQLGGKAAPACGFAMGVERIVLLMKEYQFVAPARPADAYIVHVGDGTAAQALRLAESLRDAGLMVLMHAGGGNIKTQMKKADASGARFAIIIGPEELAAGEVSVKPLRAADAQIRVAPARVAGIIQQRA